MQLAHHVRRCLLSLGLCASGLGCSGSADLTQVRTELRSGGFNLWYPAEAGIQPGQIWYLKGTEKTEIRERPELIQVKAANVKFATLSQRVDASVSLNASFAKGTFGKAGDLQGKLDAGTVKNVTLNFGNSGVDRIVVGDLLDAQKRQQFNPEYRAALDKVRNGENGWILVVATIHTAGMTYTLDVANKTAFEANAKGAIQELLGAAVVFNWQGDNKVELVIPDNQSLVIGFAPLRRELLAKGYVPLREDMPDAEYIKAASAVTLVTPANGG